VTTPNPLGQIFNGGQMTDLPEYSGAYDPTAIIEVVSPGDVQDGVNYQMTLAMLAGFVTAPQAPTIITTGATIGDPYDVLTTDTRVLINKDVPGPTYVLLSTAVSRSFNPVMIRDLKGDANVNNISISFTGTADGLSSPLLITNPYGGIVFNPLDDGNWYLTSC